MTFGIAGARSILFFMLLSKSALYTHNTVLKIARVCYFNLLERCSPRQDPFLNIAPKKLNWDLKREVADRLEQLRKRTLKAINEIVAEKARQQEEEEAENEAEGDAEGDGADHRAEDGRDSSKQARALGRSAATGSATNAEEIDLD